MIFKGIKVSLNTRNWLFWVRLGFYSTLLVAVYYLTQIGIVYSKPTLREQAIVEAQKDLKNGALCLRLSMASFSDGKTSWDAIEKEFSKYLELNSRIRIKDVGFLCGCNPETYKTEPYNEIMIARIKQEYGDGFLSSSMLRVLTEILGDNHYARIEHATPGLPEMTNLYETEEELLEVFRLHTTSRWR